MTRCLQALEQSLSLWLLALLLMLLLLRLRLRLLPPPPPLPLSLRRLLLPLPLRRQLQITALRWVVRTSTHGAQQQVKPFLLLLLLLRRRRRRAPRAGILPRKAPALPICGRWRERSGPGDPVPLPLHRCLRACRALPLDL